MLTSQTKSLSQTKRLPTVHPFPARMAPAIATTVLLKRKRKPLVVLDPMSGSGTTLMLAKAHGHHVIGVDSDPLAALISSTWCSSAKPSQIAKRGAATLDRAKQMAKKYSSGNAYPADSDEETRAFVRYWFDVRARKELAALSSSIRLEKDARCRKILWCAFSRMIITKEKGVSLAMDVSHSRPHRVYDRAPVLPFQKFLPALTQVLKAMPFATEGRSPKLKTKVNIRLGDARQLALGNGTVDLIITSPPYLNAIDYMRGHKLSLIWMGHQIPQLRGIRSDNIGSEIGEHGQGGSLAALARTVLGSSKVPNRVNAYLRRYLHDMDMVMGEMSRVLKPGGEAVVVVGNSTLRGAYIKNSKALTVLGRKHGLNLCNSSRRLIPANQRYLPPPCNKKAGQKFQSRMGYEHVLHFAKPGKMNV